MSGSRDLGTVHHRGFFELSRELLVISMLSIRPEFQFQITYVEKSTGGVWNLHRFYRKNMQCFFLKKNNVLVTPAGDLENKILKIVKRPRRFLV